MFSTILDPDYARQWHLKALGGNMEKIWTDYDGSGVHTAVYDNGLDKKHEDLIASYDTSREIKIDGVASNPNFALGFHGTSVAGLIAAGANGIGGVGVSYGAMLTDVNIFTGLASKNLVEAVSQMKNFDTVNNSWGWTTKFYDNATVPGTFGHAFALSLEEAAEEGRDGLGTIIVNSAGNSWATTHQDANSESFNQSRHSISVGAIARDGDATDYSARGASILISAPSSQEKVGSLVTTDFMGASGANGTNYRSDFGGTSGAAPIVTGVTNLMLDANENLGWRDVQTILAVTANATGPASLAGGATGRMDFGWTTNGAVNVDGGGMHFSNDVGFGLVDAYEAVRYAEIWNVFGASQTSDNERHVSVSGKGSQAIGNKGAEFTFTVNDTISIEHVDLKLSLNHESTADLQIELVSPDGTVTILHDAGGTGVSAANWSWIFGSEALRGELSTGEWTVRVSDVNGGPVGTVEGFTFDAYGSTPSADDIYHYTSDFAKAGAVDSGRSVLRDVDGGTDWINAAGLVTNTTVDLREGATSKFGLGSMAIAAGTVIENAVTGDGADTLVGNASANVLMGMRGNDLLEGRGGADTLDGGAGIDTASYLGSSAGVDIQLQRAAQIGGDAEGDRLISIEAVTGSKFGDVLVGNGEVNLLSGDDGLDMLSGLGGNDTLLGGMGDDVLNGGEGDDVLTGGAGKDIFVFDLPKFGMDLISDFVIGLDKIDLRGSGLSYASLSFGWVGSTGLISLLGGLETNGIKILNLGKSISAADFFFSAAPEPEAPPAAEETPVVVAPGDSGTSPADTPTPPNESEEEETPPTDEPTTDPVTETPGGPVSTVGLKNTTSAVSFALRSGSLNLTLVDSAVSGTGNELGNKLVGNAVGNLLMGGDGNDSLYGYAGDDILRGDNGADKLIGGDGCDTLEGGAGNDTLDGGNGADTQRGGAGADKYYVDNSGDVIDESFGQIIDDGAIDIVVSSVDFRLGAFVEKLTLVDNAVVGTGNALDNKLLGNATDNILDGGAGNDTISAGAGNDILVGGVGNDSLTGGVGADVMRGGAGADKYAVDNVGDVVDEVYGQGTDDGAVDQVTSSVDFSLGRYVENLTLTGTATFGTGNDLANKIVGNAADNRLDGGAGNDTLSGGAGNDTLIGGSGIDTLTGGAGADRFVFGRTAFGTADKISDFSVAQGDKIAVVGADFALPFGAASGGHLLADYFEMGASATSGHAQFLFDSRTKVLSFDADGHAGGAVAIATLSGLASLSSSDFLII